MTRASRRRPPRMFLDEGGRDRHLPCACHPRDPWGGGADVYADDNKAFSAVEYKTVTPYAFIADNQVTFRLRAAGQLGEPLAENRELLMDGSRYTIVAIPGERGQSAELRS